MGGRFLFYVLHYCGPYNENLRNLPMCENKVFFTSLVSLFFCLNFRFPFRDPGSSSRHRQGCHRRRTTASLGSCRMHSRQVLVCRASVVAVGTRKSEGLVRFGSVRLAASEIRFSVVSKSYSVEGRWSGSNGNQIDPCPRGWVLQGFKL